MNDSNICNMPQMFTALTPFIHQSQSLVKTFFKTSAPSCCAPEPTAFNSKASAT